MRSKKQIKPHEPSRLLLLPREIRDLIYEHVLVRDVIPIECAVTNMSPSRFARRRTLSFSDGLKEMYPCKRPRSQRRIWSVPAFDIDLSIPEGDSINDPKIVHMTYQLANSIASSRAYGIEIRLLQVCNQIYSEAKSVFYCKNTFSFTGDYRIPTTFAFLCDRPAESLLLIKSLELALLEDNNLRGTTQAHYPVMRRSTDSLALQYAYHHFTDLCTLMSNPRMRLKRLHLTIETLAARTSTAPNSIQDCLSWEERKTNQSRPWTPSWIEPLLKLSGLESMTVYWVFDRPRLRRMVDTVSMMQQCMLSTKRSKSPVRHDSVTGNGFNFWMLHQDDNAEDVYVHYVPPVKVPCWKYHCLDGNLGVTEERGNGKTIQETIAQRQHIQDIMALSDGVYVCYAELQSS